MYILNLLRNRQTNLTLVIFSKFVCLKQFCEEKWILGPMHDFPLLSSASDKLRHIVCLLTGSKIENIFLAD